MSVIEELRQDLLEYEALHKTAKRTNVREYLSKEMERLRRDLTSLEAKAGSGTGATEGAGDQPVVYHENVTNYAWDQSDKFMKLYLTLPDLGTITEKDIQADFTNRSVTVKVKFAKKISTLHIARLCEEVNAKDCYCKKKSDYVLVMLKKVEVGKTWPWVTEREKKAKEDKKPKFDDNADPSAGITNMLKNMYDDGDDEMKRTISKAFYESQMKQQRGEGMDGMDI